MNVHNEAVKHNFNIPVINEGLKDEAERTQMVQSANIFVQKNKIQQAVKTGGDNYLGAVKEDAREKLPPIQASAAINLYRKNWKENSDD